MSFVMFPHGGSGNHGCEAIVRSTVSILHSKPILFSSNPSEDYKYGLDKICEIKNDIRAFSRKDFIYWKSLFSKYVLREKDAYDISLYRSLIKESEISDSLLSIGGDNYCYGNPKFITLVNKAVRKKGVRTILWGCSIEPEAINGEIIEDLKNYSHIYARESLTYHALVNKGINQVSLLPDPAFILQSEDVCFPKGFNGGNIVGINASPMIIGHERGKGIILSNYEKLIQYIIEKTDMNIALIPHVVWKHNDDRLPLLALYNKFKSSRRLFMVDDCNAEQLKGYISKCRFFVAARTHASIAAYSSKVPTIVIGYSVKATGIAKDIFGTDENYVFPAQQLERANSLASAFKWLENNENDVRKHLNQTMPKYIKKIQDFRLSI